MNRSPVEAAAHRILLMVLRCKNSDERYRLNYIVRRPDAFPLPVGLDWALESGLVTYGTTNASARAWSRRPGNPGIIDSDGYLYLTKAGKAWLRSFGSDFGSSMLQSEMLATAKAAA